jgi:hypothetical protein
MQTMSFAFRKAKHLFLFVNPIDLRYCFDIRENGVEEVNPHDEQSGG